MDGTPEAPKTALHPVAWGGPLLAAGAALLLYLVSLEPGAFWGDSASFASHLDTSPKPFARSYWLYKLLGRGLTGFGLTGASAANLASAVYGAAAVGLLYALAQRLTGNLWAAALSACSLAVAHTFWLHGAVAEVYSLLALFELGLLFLALGAPERPREAVGLGLVAGLALNHHRLLFFSFAVLVPFLWLRLAPDRRREILRHIGLGLGLGVLPWLILCLQFPPSSLEVPEGMSALQLWLQKTLLGGAWSSQHLTSGEGRGLLSSLLYLARLLALNFPSPAGLLALVGLWGLVKTGAPARKVLLIGHLIAYALAGSLFDWTGDQYAFFSPVLPLVALLAGLGLARLSEPGAGPLAPLSAALSLLLPPLLYAWLAFSAPPPGDRPPDRLDRQEFLWPAKAGYELPERWCRARLQALPAGSTLVSQWAEGTVFEYLQTTGLRPDVRLLMHRSGPLDLEGVDGRVFVSWKPTRALPPEALRELDLDLIGTEPGFREVARP